MTIDLLGYLGMILLIFALFSMGRSKKGFLLNALANLIMMIYGILLGAIPIVILDAILTLISIYNFFKKPKKDLEIHL